jgi:hypothetical protein
MNFNFFCSGTGEARGAFTIVVVVGTAAVCVVNIVPNPIFESVSCDSNERRYAGPSDIIYTTRNCGFRLLFDRSKLKKHE